MIELDDTNGEPRKISQKSPSDVVSGLNFDPLPRQIDPKPIKTVKEPPVNQRALIAVAGVALAALGTYLQAGGPITLEGALQVLGAALLGWLVPQPSKKP